MRAPLLAATALLLAAPAAAQSTSAPVLEPAYVAGVTVGLPHLDGTFEAVGFMLGAHWTPVRPGRVGVDAAVVTMPATVVFASPSLGARVGLAFPLAVARGSILVPSAGVSAGGLAGAHGAVGGTGLQAGVALVVLGARRGGLRVGATRHVSTGGERGSVWVLEVGSVSGR